MSNFEAIGELLGAWLAAENEFGSSEVDFWDCLSALGVDASVVDAYHEHNRTIERENQRKHDIVLREMLKAGVLVPSADGTVNFCRDINQQWYDSDRVGWAKARDACYETARALDEYVNSGAS